LFPVSAQLIKVLMIHALGPLYHFYFSDRNLTPMR
jgi:hypothetical protein